MDLQLNLILKNKIKPFWIPPEFYRTEEPNMVFNTEKGKYVENSVGISDEFQIKADEKLFMLLSDSVYSDKIAAGIREIACNAYDAHIEAEQERKFQVTVPSRHKPEFRVRDFGKGLSPEQMSMYTTYGDSSKEGSNAYIGAFGIGAKSPFAYTNTFNVTSYYNGKAYYYVMFVEQGKPRKTLLSECETDEPSGLEVFYAVELSDVGEFRQKSIKILKWMKDKVEVLNADSDWLDEFETTFTTWQPADYLGQNFGEIGIEVSDRRYGNELQVVQGNVLYTISQEECREAFEASVDKEDDSSFFKVKKIATENICFEGTIKVPNGTFMPQPSRERISFTPETKEKLGSILCLIYHEKVTNRINKMFKEARNSYLRLHRLWTVSPRIVKENSKFDDLYFKGYGKSFKDWNRSLVENIRAVRISPVNQQASTTVIKQTTAGKIASDLLPIYVYSDGAYLSFEKKCRILENVGTALVAGSPIAYVVFNDTSKFFSDKDLEEMKNVNDLPKSSTAFLTKWKPSPASVTGALTVICTHTGNVVRTTKVFKDSENPTQQEIDYTFWIPADRAYKVEFIGGSFDFEYKQGRKDFARLFALSASHYAAKHQEETQERFYGKTRVVLLPKGHPFREILPKFEDIILEGAKHYIDLYESELEWNMSYYDEKYIPWVKALFDANLIDKIGLAPEVVSKYKAWSAQSFKTGHRMRPFENLAYLPLDHTYLAKIWTIKKSVLDYTLDVEDEILRPMFDKFPLVKFLYDRYSARENPAVTADLIEYVENKLDKAVIEDSKEKSA